MIHNAYFNDLLAKSNNQYVGIGNPNAKILFVGKEAGIEIGKINYHGNLQSWKDEKNDYSRRFIPLEQNLRNLNHTWQRYQKLYDNVLSKLGFDNELMKEDKYEVTFVENVFTTELSNLHAPNTNDAKKQENFSKELKQRKQVFFKSKFIEHFPIIVIFASDNKYIETYQGEVCELFNVKFDELYNYSGKDKIWIHSSLESNSPKLLIHTRQLTNRISTDLIDSLGIVISNFIKENSINIKVK